jgi:hypothetical protein
MHAVSRDAEAFGRPCVYIQLDEGSEQGMAADGDEEDAEDDLTAELRLVPAEEAAGQLSQRVQCVFALAAAIMTTAVLQ